MRRQAKPYQQFKKDMGKFYGGNSRLFTDSQCRYMQRVFKHFPDEYHEAIAKYPVWLGEAYREGKYDIHNAIADVKNIDEAIRLMTSFDWIEVYLKNTRQWSS